MKTIEIPDVIPPGRNVNLRVLTIGSDDGKDECRCGRVVVEVRRGVTPENHDRPGWKYADLSFELGSTGYFKVLGLARADVKALADFLYEYEQRMRDF